MLQPEVSINATAGNVQSLISHLFAICMQQVELLLPELQQSWDHRKLDRDNEKACNAYCELSLPQHDGSFNMRRCINCGVTLYTSVVLWCCQQADQLGVKQDEHRLYKHKANKLAAKIKLSK